MFPHQARTRKQRALVMQPIYEAGSGPKGCSNSDLPHLQPKGGTISLWESRGWNEDYLLVGQGVQHPALTGFLTGLLELTSRVSFLGLISAFCT